MVRFHSPPPILPFFNAAHPLFKSCVCRSSSSPGGVHPHSLPACWRFPVRRALLLLFCFVSAAVVTSPAQTASAAPSQINVTDAHYGTGCPNPADPSGRLDSTCAIRAAITAAESSGMPGAGYPTLFFPHGRYKVAGEGYTSALTLTKAVNIQGAGENNTVLVNTSPHAATLTYTQAGDCSGMPQPCTPLRHQHRLHRHGPRHLRRPDRDRQHHQRKHA